MAASASKDVTLRLVIELWNKADAKLKQAQTTLNDFSTRAKSAGTAATDFGNKAQKGFGAAQGAAGKLQTFTQRANEMSSALSGGLSGAAQGAGGSVGTLVAAVGAGLGVLVAATAAVNALTAGLRAVNQYLAESRDAWSTQNEAILQLDAVWKSMKRSIPTEEIHSFAAELQQSSVYGDEAIAKATRMLATYPEITDELMKESMKTMVDFAAMTGTTLDGAANTIGKASMGMVGELRRVGITLSDATMASKDFKDILREINEQVGGQAAARASTWAGRITQLTNAYGDLQEEVGKIQEKGFSGFFEPITKRFADLAVALGQAIDAGKLDKFIGQLQSVTAFGVEVVQSLIDVVVDLAISFKEMVENNTFIPHMRQAGQAIRTTTGYVITMAKWMRVLYNFMTGDWKEGAELMRDLMSSGAKDGAKATQDAEKQIKESWKNINAEAKKKKAGDVETPSEIQKRYAVLLEAAKSSYDERRRLLDLETAGRKAAITESTQSEVRAQQELEQIEREASQRRIQIRTEEFEETKRIKAAAYEAEKAALEQLASDPKKAAEARKKLNELESKYNQEQIKDLRSVSEAVDKELTRQIQKREEYTKKVQSLQQQAQDADRATADALQQVYATGANEYDRFIMKLAEARGKLAEATALMPTFPEKALQLAKEAQSAFAALAQDTNSLQQNLKNNQQLVADALRDVQKTGLTGVAKWKADLEDVTKLLERARQAQAAGQSREAGELYKQVVQQAKALASGAPDTMRAGAKTKAEDLIRKAGQGLQSIDTAAIAEAANTNAEITSGIQEAGQLIKSEIDRQIEAVKTNIDALNKNTEALRQRKEEVSRASEQTQAAARERAAAGTPMQEAAPSGPTAEELAAQKPALTEVNRQVQEAGATTGPVAGPFNIGSAIASAIDTMLGGISGNITGALNAAQPTAALAGGGTITATEAGGMSQSEFVSAVRDFRTFVQTFGRYVDNSKEIRVKAEVKGEWD